MKPGTERLWYLILAYHMCRNCTLNHSVTCGGDHHHSFFRNEMVLESVWTKHFFVPHAVPETASPYLFYPAVTSLVLPSIEKSSLKVD